jgi:hypothetical protein
MGKAAAPALAILALLSGAALADPAGDYAALVTAAQDGDPGTDYTAMRLAYAQLADYDPYGIKTNGLMQDGQSAYLAKDCKTALEKFKAAIAIDFTISQAHALSADCMEQAGDQAAEKREEAIAQGLFDSIMTSGDGQRPESAFIVVSLHEEEVVLAVAGLQGTAQALLDTKEGPVDQISVADEKTGKKGTLYFNVTALFAGMARQKEKPEPTP